MRLVKIIIATMLAAAVMIVSTACNTTIENNYDASTAATQEITPQNIAESTKNP